MNKLHTQHFYSIDKIAQRLEVKESTVRTWLKAGKLDGFKINGKWRVGSDSLERFLEQCQEN